MKRTSIIVLLVAIGAATLLIARFRNSRTSSTTVAESSSTLKGQKAPDFALESLDSRTVHLSDFHGKAILLNFWATWCTPCKYEMPWFEQMQKQYGPQGLQVLGITMDTSEKNEIAEFANDLGIDYPILFGKESVVGGYECFRSVPVTI